VRRKLRPSGNTNLRRATWIGPATLLLCALTLPLFSTHEAGAQADDCPAVPSVVEGDPQSSFTGELLKREDGIGTFKVSPNPRDPKVDVFFDNEITYLAKGETYRVRSTVVPGAVIPTSNVSCGWTLTADGNQVSTDRIDLPENALETLALAVVVGLTLAFGLIFVLLAIKTGMWGIGRGIRTVATRRFS